METVHTDNQLHLKSCLTVLLTTAHVIMNEHR